MMGNNETLALATIQIDGGTQIREAIHEDTIENYLEAKNAGATFPPVVVFHDGKRHWLADGFHRYHTALRFEAKTMRCEVFEGTQRDALRYAAQANKTHGLPRTNKDKRNAVMVYLLDDEWSRYSDRKIAEEVGVSHNLVSTMRREVAEAQVSSDDTSNPDIETATRTGKDGKSYLAKPKEQPKADTDQPVRVESRQPGEDAPPRANGKEVFTIKERKRAAKFLGQLIRVLDKSPRVWAKARGPAEELAILIERGIE